MDMDIINVTEMVDGHVENITRNMNSNKSIRKVHPMLHEDHKGNEPMNTELLLLVMVTMIFVQVHLIVWKRRHFQSFKTVTSLALWLIPFIICIDLSYSYWKFIVFWTGFSLITGFILRKALEKPLQESTPRLVYKIWFYFIYKLTFILCIVGYLIWISGFLGINALFNVKPDVWYAYGIQILFYALYFGVLGQDFAEMSTSLMAANLGYYTTHGFPTRYLDKHICAVCGNKVIDGKKGIIESTIQLTCGHIFHEFCIQRWYTVGKKQTCPYCKEIINFYLLFGDLLNKPHLVYALHLAHLRRSVIWVPTFIILILLIVLGLMQLEFDTE